MYNNQFIQLVNKVLLEQTCRCYLLYFQQPNYIQCRSSQTIFKLFYKCTVKKVDRSTQDISSVKVLGFYSLIAFGVYYVLM